MEKSGQDNIYILPFEACTKEDVALVGGKNASLGEMIGLLGGKGIQVPGGFVTTVNAYWDFLYENKLREPIGKLLESLDRKNYTNLKETGAAIRAEQQREW